MLFTLVSTHPLNPPKFTALLLITFNLFSSSWMIFYLFGFNRYLVYLFAIVFCTYNIYYILKEIGKKETDEVKLDNLKLKHYLIIISAQIIGVLCFVQLIETESYNILGTSIFE